VATRFRVLLLCSAIVGASRDAVSQAYATDRGVWQPGGGLSLGHSKVSQTGSEQIFVNVYPAVGYFVVRGLVVSLGVPLSYSNYWGPQHGHTFYYGITPGITYYFRHGPHRLYPFVGGGGLIYWYRGYERSNPGVTFRNEYSGWSVQAGALRLMSRNFGIYGETYFQRSHAKFEATQPFSFSNSNTQTNYGLQFGVSFFIY